MIRRARGVGVSQASRCPSSSASATAGSGAVSASPARAARRSCGFSSSVERSAATLADRPIHHRRYLGPGQPFEVAQDHAGARQSAARRTVTRGEVAPDDQLAQPGLGEVLSPGPLARQSQGHQGTGPRRVAGQHVASRSNGGRSSASQAQSAPTLPGSARSSVLVTSSGYAPPPSRTEESAYIGGSAPQLRGHRPGQPPASTEAKAQLPRVAETTARASSCTPGQVVRSLERLGVDLVHVLGTRRAGGEPGGLRTSP
jgi:hypothetical protein